MVGVDEVGRGCLAGPLLVVAARAKTELPEGLTDSKALTRAHREEFYAELFHICDFGEGWVSAKEINRLGLTAATRLGVRRALSGLRASPEETIIMDGNYNYCPKKYRLARPVVKADLNIPIVSAASIIAKVRRDAYMRQLPKRYAGYGFESHVGYSTKQHITALRTLGPIPDFHRTFYAPLRLLEQS